MYNPKAKANALATVGAGLYLICAVWSMVSRDSFVSVVKYWMHGIDLTALPTKIPDVTSVLIGLVTFTIAAWITGYAVALAYNYFEKKK